MSIHPPPYERLVWNFKKLNNDAVKKAIELVKWDFLSINKSIHEQVTIFGQTLVNIFSNYIPNKLITVDEKYPPWMNKTIKKKIMAKKYACKSFNANKKNYDAYLKLQTISTELSEMILKRKEGYYRLLSDKLNDPHTSAKSYWSIVKNMYNGKKIPLIPPILISNRLISNLKEKANHFNAFFASQCIPVLNNSILPTLHLTITTPVTNASLSSISLNDRDILQIIHSLNINKVHGCDDISITLLKICNSSIVRPLSILFKNCLQSGSFSNNWKKSNVVPIHKNGDKQLLQNYQPVSLLPICDKIFERIIFNPIFEYLEKTVFSVQINLVYVHLTHVKTSYYQSFMTFMLILIHIQLLTTVKPHLDYCDISLNVYSTMLPLLQLVQ